MRDLIDRLHPVHGGSDLVRLGPDADGGYLVPDDLEGITSAFSPGVSTESGFEVDLAARGMQVFLADHSVEGPAQPHPQFVFDKRYVGSLTDDTFFTLSDWKNARLPGDAGDLLLQMDVEGAEYETLLATPTELLAQFRIMVIEFHYLHELFSRSFFGIASRVFDKLLQTHAVVHIHPNNCCGSVRSGGLEIPRIAELTLHRRDRMSQAEPCRTFPHPLDRDNTAKPTLPLPACWHA
ncbi:hypothetical protein G7072_07440 [Nocardioides sp. HDW12B]|uniref:FkbM family methyltransferase n=1 Tax=Nocardioides sp. HDW12B TaxID=2714939 RepID=UPI0014097464|nr:FkbM family methyltransferase [Nocardioides sp. HDW12B]QIK66201.1 hypothetical protein G7072_07440 [Nocardioides sp. HDW12B]